MIFKKNQLAMSISSALLTGAFVMTGLVSTAQAEDQAATNPPAPPAPVIDDSSVVRVTITAQNRTQQLQEVPISLLVVSTDQITKLAANNLADMNGYITGLVVNADQPTQPGYTIRGIGNSDFGIGTDSPVGIYVDGVYTGKTGGALMNFNDMERVEVLKGPQGTLFGRNSAAGAISVVTKDPSNDVENDINVKLGQYGERNLSVLLNAPLSDTLALRFSAVDQHSNGWLKDSATGEGLNGTGDWGLRMALRWNAPEHTKVILSWEHEDLNEVARPDIGLIPAALQTPAPPFPANPANYLNPLTAPVYNNGADNKEKRLFNGVTLRIDHPMDWATFDSTTAARHFTSSNITDNTGTNQINTFLDTGNIEANTTWQQEFKFSGKNDTVDWLAGVSFFSEKATQTSAIMTNTDTLNTITTNTAGFPLYTLMNAFAQGAGINVNLLGNSWQENMNNTATAKSYAVYGDAIWHISSKMNLTTGIRFSDDKKELTWNSPQRIAPGLDTGIATLNNNNFFTATLPGIVGPSLASLAYQGLITNIEYPVANYSMSSSWTDVSPRVVLDYQFTPDVMAYGSVAKGYQSGGFNSQKPGGVYQPETVWNYELGMKSYIADLHLLINPSFFYYKFNNLQSLTLIPNGSAIPQYQVSSSDQSAMGLDLDVSWQPSRNLRLFTNGEFIDQKYGQFSLPDPTSTTGGVLVLNGQPVGTPKWFLAAGVDYKLRDVLGGKVDFSLQHAYTGPTRCNSDSLYSGNCLTTSTFKLGGSSQHTDGRIAWDADNQKWGLALYANNLLNNRNVTGMDTTSVGVLGTAAAQISAPRIVGLQFHLSL